NRVQPHRTAALTAARTSPPMGIGTSRPSVAERIHKTPRFTAYLAGGTSKQIVSYRKNADRYEFELENGGTIGYPETLVERIVPLQSVLKGTVVRVLSSNCIALDNGTNVTLFGVDVSRSSNLETALERTVLNEEVTLSLDDANAATNH